MSLTNYNSYLNEDCVREVNKHIVAELQQRLNRVEKDVILWTGQQFDFLPYDRIRVGFQLYKIAYCLDAVDFDIKMLSRSFVGLIENITANSNEKKTHAEHITKQIAVLESVTQENSEHFIKILIKRRYECMLHIVMNDDEIEKLIQSNNDGLFDYIYGLLEEKHSLKMLMKKLRV